MADLAEVAAQIHANMCNDEGFGYSWEERHGTPDDVVTWRINGRDYSVWRGDYDCSSSIITAWQAALEGTPYEGALDNASYTGNMLEVFVNSGLFSWESMDYVAQRGDIYLNIAYHTAMCQSAVPDMLSEFSSNEYGGAYGGQRGDQTGWESHITDYYNYPWDGILRYNGAGDSPEEEDNPQEPGDKVNEAGLVYKAHVANYGWLPEVADGQTAGTTGHALRLEAVKVSPPEGWELEISVHVANLGWKKFAGIVHGPIDDCQVIGTVGQALQVEDVIVDVVNRPEGDNRKLYFKVHQANTGWKGWTEEGFSSGTDGMSLSLEAVQMKIE